MRKGGHACLLHHKILLCIYLHKKLLQCCGAGRRGGGEGRRRRGRKGAGQEREARRSAGGDPAGAGEPLPAATRHAVPGGQDGDVGFEFGARETAFGSSVMTNALLPLARCVYVEFQMRKTVSRRIRNQPSQSLAGRFEAEEQWYVHTDPPGSIEELKWASVVKC